VELSLFFSLLFVVFVVVPILFACANILCGKWRWIYYTVLRSTSSVCSFHFLLL